MTEQMVALLSAEIDEAWETLRHRLEGLTDKEFFWEPVSGCWTVRLAEDGRWIVDYAEPAPDPPPFTTIAWLEEGHARLRVALDGLSDADLDEMRLTN